MMKERIRLWVLDKERLSAIFLLVVIALGQSSFSCHGWIQQPSATFSRPFSVLSSTSTTATKITSNNNRHLLTVLLQSSLPVIASNNLGPDESVWKQEGERIIIKAAVGAGATPEMLRIDWKAGRIVVTVDAGSLAYMAGGEAMEGEEIEEDFMDEMEDEDGDDEIDDDSEDFGDEMDMDDEEETMEEFEEDDLSFEEGLMQELGLVEEEPQTMEGVDVVAIAKAINAAFDEEGEGSLGFSIAVHHSIEVTTPGATDELSGIMFESYKGFDVIVELKDSKTGKTKKIEGKLVERNDEITQINERGRMRKLQNYLVASVRLPKAKVEKGVNAAGGSKKKKSPKKKRK